MPCCKCNILGCVTEINCDTSYLTKSSNVKRFNRPILGGAFTLLFLSITKIDASLNFFFFELFKILLRVNYFGLIMD